MDKKRFFSIGIGAGVVLIASAALFVTAYLSLSKLKDELKTAQGNLSSTYEAKQEVELFEKTKTDFKKQEKLLYKKVLLNEKESFNLIKDITKLAREFEITGITFAPQDRKSATAQSSGGTGSGSAGTQGGSQPEQDGLYRLPIQMNMECEYSRLIGFLSKLTSLPRIISIEQLDLTRQEDILPRLKVKLVISAYTFVESQTKPPAP